MKYVDLHVHTHFSDGTFSPQEVVACAKEKNLSAIAICDHDCIDGVRQAIELGEQIGLEVIPGIEMTVEWRDEEIHVLGYLIDIEYEWFTEKLRAMQQYRVDRMYKMIEKLREQNIAIDPRSVFTIAGLGSVGRPHLAQAMLLNGKADSMREIFGKYLGDGKPCHVPNRRFDPREAIGAVRKAGGVPVLAHPYTVGKDELIPELAEYGLRGIEVYHTDHRSKERKRYEEIAKENGLIATGGSDCHGFGKGRILMGGTKVPYAILEQVKEEARKIRQANSA
ncbi:MAG: PHP domain-containing protein [Candidatus Omnitrophota bacterium]